MRAVLHLCYQADQGEDGSKGGGGLAAFLCTGSRGVDPVKVYVSTELTCDVKDRRFGHGNETTYDTCHRGITPFAVLQVSMEQQHKRRKIQEHQRNGGGTGQLPDYLLNDAWPAAQKVHPVSDGVVWSRVCSPVRGAGSLPDPVDQVQCVRANVRRLGRGNALACVHRCQRVFQSYRAGFAGLTALCAAQLPAY